MIHLLNSKLFRLSPLTLSIFLSLTACGQWEIKKQDLTTYESVFFISESVGFCCGNVGLNCVIIKTTDSGETWSEVYSAPGVLYDIFFPSESIGYASGYGNVLKSEDYGETWFDPNLEMNDQYFESIYFLDDLNGYGAGSGSLLGFGLTNDGGNTWLIDNEAGCKELYANDICELEFISGGYYGITSNCFEDWQAELINPNNNRSLMGLKLRLNHTYCCGLGVSNSLTNFGFVGRKSVGANFWTVTDFPLVLQLSSIEFPNEEIGFCVGQPLSSDKYPLMASNDSGTTWYYQAMQEMINENDEPFYPFLKDICCPSDSVCFAVGNYCIYRTGNGGGSMIAQATVNEITEKAKENIQLYPNPAEDKLSISGLDKGFNGTIVIFDGVGRKVTEVSTKSLFEGSQSGKLEIDVADYASGIYVVQLFENNISSSLPFLKE